MLVENFVDITLSHLAGIITDLSVLLKKIPEFGGAGLSVIFVLTPVCKPTPSNVMGSLRVKHFIKTILRKYPKSITL
jgi:hypothetical protein